MLPLSCTPRAFVCFAHFSCFMLGVSIYVINNHLIPGSQMLPSEESDRVEFKSSLRYSHEKEVPPEVLEHSVFKTICAFLNTSGGTLYIGVADDGAVIGLEMDYNVLPTRKRDRDGFEQLFAQLFNNLIGKASISEISQRYESIEGKDVYVVEVKASPHPVHLKRKGKEEFFVRNGTRSEPLSPSEATSYAIKKWPVFTAPDDVAYEGTDAQEPAKSSVQSSPRPRESLIPGQVRNELSWYEEPSVNEEPISKWVLRHIADGHSVFIDGDSGLGKTLLMARVCLNLPQDVVPCIFFVQRQLGPRHSRTESILLSLTDQLRTGLHLSQQPLEPAEVRDQLSARVEEFSETLRTRQELDSENRLVVFIDGLDENLDVENENEHILNVIREDLEDPYLDIQWVLSAQQAARPHWLPAHFKRLRLEGVDQITANKILQRYIPQAWSKRFFDELSAFLRRSQIKDSTYDPEFLHMIGSALGSLHSSVSPIDSETLRGFIADLPTAPRHKYRWWFQTVTEQRYHRRLPSLQRHSEAWAIETAAEDYCGLITDILAVLSETRRKIPLDILHQALITEDKNLPKDFWGKERPRFVSYVSTLLGEDTRSGFLAMALEDLYALVHVEGADSPAIFFQKEAIREAFRQYLGENRLESARLRLSSLAERSVSLLTHDNIDDLPPFLASELLYLLWLGGKDTIRRAWNIWRTSGLFPYFLRQRALCNSDEDARTRTGEIARELQILGTDQNTPKDISDLLLTTSSVLLDWDLHLNSRDGVLCTAMLLGSEVRSTVFFPNFTSTSHRLLVPEGGYCQSQLWTHGEITSIVTLPERRLLLRTASGRLVLMNLSTRTFSLLEFSSGLRSPYLCLTNGNIVEIDAKELMVNVWCSRKWARLSATTVRNPDGRPLRDTVRRYRDDNAPAHFLPLGPCTQYQANAIAWGDHHGDVATLDLDTGIFSRYSIYWQTDFDNMDADDIEPRPDEAISIIRNTKGVLVGGHWGTIKLWSFSDGPMMVSTVRERGMVPDLLSGPDGTQGGVPRMVKEIDNPAFLANLKNDLFAVLDSHNLEIWDALELKKLRTVGKFWVSEYDDTPPDPDFIEAEYLKSTPAGDLLIIGPRHIWKWNCDTDVLQCVKDDFRGRLRSVPDEESLVIQNEDKSIELWDTTNQEASTLVSIDNSKVVTHLRFLPHGKSIWTLADKTRQLRDKDLSVIQELKSNVAELDWAPLGPKHSIALQGTCIHLREEPFGVAEQIAFPIEISDFALLEDSCLAVTDTQGRRISIVDLSSGERQELDAGVSLPTQISQNEYVPKLRKLYTLGKDFLLFAWEEDVITAFNTENISSRHLHFAPTSADSNIIITRAVPVSSRKVFIETAEIGDYTGIIYEHLIWDVEDDTATKVSLPKYAFMVGVSAILGNNLILIGKAPPTRRLFLVDVTDGTIFGTVSCDSEIVYAGRLSNRHFVSLSRDQIMRIWDIEQLCGPKHVAFVEFNPNTVVIDEANMRLFPLPMAVDFRGFDISHLLK